LDKLLWRFDSVTLLCPPGVDPGGKQTFPTRPANGQGLSSFVKTRRRNKNKGGLAFRKGMDGEGRIFL
jgi:hypothetical protein